MTLSFRLNSMIKSLVRAIETSTEKELAAVDENNLVRLVNVIGSKFVKPEVQRDGSVISQVYKQSVQFKIGPQWN